MNILLVEDDKDSRVSLSEFLHDLGHAVSECDNGLQALDLFGREYFNLVLTDIKMPKMNGISLLRKLKTSFADRKFHVVLFTGHGDMESAIEALRAGAFDYLLKPVNIEQLANLIAHLADNLGSVGEDMKNQDFFMVDGIGHVGVFSQKAKEIFQQACKLHYDRDIPVLIQGETGTGKEVVAKLIHKSCSESEPPFIDINCAALTSTLFESELFGYEAGAYTGALDGGSKGKIDMASGGTLFLDEIGELSLELQAKLLRVIQEKEFFRVGGLKKIKSQMRLICATNVDLEKKVSQGLFRPDLFYRLNVGRILLPPLRERREEIIPLAQMFLKEFAGKKRKKFTQISDEAADLLSSYSWPGNIRELRNTIEWAVFMYDDINLKAEYLSMINKCEIYRDPIDQTKVASNLAGIEFALPLDKMPLENCIDEVILRTLEMHNGNKAKTARYLGISRRSIYCRLERLREKTEGDI